MPNIVTTTAECELAANQLGLAYQWQSLEDDKYPAGCYFSGSKVYFHTELDPTKTKPTPDYGGVCMGTFMN